MPRYSLYSFTLFPISCYHHIIKRRLCVLFGPESVRFLLFLDFCAFIWYTARSQPREQLATSRPKYETPVSRGRKKGARSSCANHAPLPPKFAAGPFHGAPSPSVSCLSCVPCFPACWFSSPRVCTASRSVSPSRTTRSSSRAANFPTLTMRSRATGQPLSGTTQSTAAPTSCLMIIRLALKGTASVTQSRPAARSRLVRCLYGF